MSQDFDLFISYAHRDDACNPGDDGGRIAAIKSAIEKEYLAMTGRELRVFHDNAALLTGQIWRETLLKGLKSSKMMLAVISANYFKSDYCRLEWEHYVETELDQALPGEGIIPIYIVRCPAFDDMSINERLRRWARDLSRRQLDMRWLDWWPSGRAVLEQEDVSSRIKEITVQVRDRLEVYQARQESPTNQIPVLSRHFKGRHRELHELRANLVKGHMSAITAVHGVPGIGKTELALAYAWGYGGYYPGGRFYLSLPSQFQDEQEALSSLQQRVADLAAYKEVPISDAERQTPGEVFRKVCHAFQRRPDQQALFIVDNIDDPALLQTEVLQQGLPQGDHIDIILTTRLEPVMHFRRRFFGA